jgi:hypothetical protein
MRVFGDHFYFEFKRIIFFMFESEFRYFLNVLFILFPLSKKFFYFVACFGRVDSA